MLLGRKIQILRENKGFTQTYLAQVLGVTSQVVYDWENCTSSPDILKLRDLSRLLDVTTDELLDPEFEPQTIIAASASSTPNLIATSQYTDNDVLSDIRFLTDSLSIAIFDEYIELEVTKIKTPNIAQFSFEKPNVISINNDYLLDNGITYKLLYSIIKLLFVRKAYQCDKIEPLSSNVTIFNNYSTMYATFVSEILFNKTFEKVVEKDKYDFIKSHSPNLRRFLEKLKSSLNLEIVDEFINGYSLPTISFKQIGNTTTTIKPNLNIPKTNVVNTYVTTSNQNSTTTSNNYAAISVGLFVVFVVILLILNSVYLYGFFDGIPYTLGQCVIPTIPVVLLAKKKIAKKGAIISSVIVFMSLAGNFNEMLLQGGVSDGFGLACLYALLISGAYMLGMYFLYKASYGGANNE